jgi:3'(2'), 5'-bisphosphate nucleotidase
MSLADSDPAITDALGEAIRLAKDAGAFIETVRAEGFSTERKEDNSPVTRADTGADQIIREGLAALFPDDGILSEEHGMPPSGTSGRTWVIDPLDGTRGFIAGTNEFAVQIGMLVGEEPVLGVVYEPALDRLAWGATGMGTYLVMRGGTTYPARLSPRSEFRDMRLVTSTSVTPERRQDLLSALGCQAGGAYHSVGVKIASILRGESDIYWSGHKVSYWDSCAPLVVLREAGGILTTIDGEPYTYPLAVDRFEHPTSFVATSGSAHGQVCEKLRALL